MLAIILLTRNLMNLIFIVAIRAIPTRFATAVGVIVPVFAIGAIPSMLTEFLGTVCVTRTAVAIDAVPVTGITGFVVGMSRFVDAATPAMFAGFVFGITLPVVAVAVHAPPVVRTTFGLSVNSRRRSRLKTIDTEPVLFRTRLRHCVMFVACRTRPIMVAAVILQQDIFAR